MASQTIPKHLNTREVGVRATRKLPLYENYHYLIMIMGYVKAYDFMTKPCDLFGSLGPSHNELCRKLFDF